MGLYLEGRMGFIRGGIHGGGFERKPFGKSLHSVCRWKRNLLEFQTSQIGPGSIFKMLGWIKILSDMVWCYLHTSSAICQKPGLRIWVGVACPEPLGSCPVKLRSQSEKDDIDLESSLLKRENSMRPWQRNLHPRFCWYLEKQKVQTGNGLGQNAHRRPTKQRWQARGERKPGDRGSSDGEQ